MIYIFGPGNAKLELKKLLERNKVFGRVIRTEPAPKMSGNQIVAKVRNYYNILQPLMAQFSGQSFECERQGAC